MPEVPVYWKYTSKDNILGFVSPDGELIAGKPATYSVDGNDNPIGLINTKTGGQLFTTGSIGNTLRKIKASIAGAFNNNSVELAPLNPAPLFVSTTAYGYGQAVCNASGNVYLQTTLAGITSGATAPTGTTPSLLSDGTNTCWLYIGNQRTATALPDAPVVTHSATITGLTLQVNSWSGTGVAVATNPQLFFTGGFGIGSSTNQGSYIANEFLGAATGNLNGSLAGTQWVNYSMNGGRVEFMTDAPKIGLYIGGATSPTNPVLIDVDNRRVFDGQVVSGTSIGSGYKILDFTGSGAYGRKTRKIRLSFFANTGLNWIRVDPLSKVYAPINANRYRIVCEGDSLTIGASGTGSNFAPVGQGIGWTEQFANLVGCDDICNVAEGGTGFQTSTLYITRLPFIATLNPDVLMIMGNSNDTANSDASQQAAMLTYLQQARALMPNVIIMFFGTQAMDTGPNAQKIAADANIQAAITAANDPLIYFYSTINDVSGSWFTGTGNTTSPSGTGNADLYVGNGGTHPTQQGHEYMARRYANAFKSIINSIPT